MNRLYFHSRVLIYLTVLIVVGGCQKVIDLPIDDQEQVIIFEGVLKNMDSASYFNVSKTVGIYEPGTQEIVSGASISIQDNNMVNYIFTEDGANPGTYVNYNFVAQENQTYYLTADVEGELITATSFSKSKPILDSIYQRPNALDQNTPQSNWVFYHATDPINETNYYRLRIWKNGEEPSQYYIGNDFFINGETYEAQFFGVAAYPGDSIKIEFQEMDPEVYDYIYGLSSTLITGPFSPAPANPPSNLVTESESTATGYFAVYMTDTATMIVQ